MPQLKDSHQKIDFSDSQRNITLLQGEALFTVEQDARRPFIVSTGTASIQALGTQFNVRRRHDETEVSVVEGMVQVDAQGTPPRLPAFEDAPASNAQASSQVASVKPLTAARLVAGEEAKVQSGMVAKRARPDVANTLAWRSRRLVFTNASFDDVAAEFNRYNRAQVRIEGAAAEKKLTGIFDADRPRAFVLYAMRDLSLSVETEGDDWVIRSR